MRTLGMLVLLVGCYQSAPNNGGDGGNYPPGCTPKTCDDLGASCGRIDDDGCGHPLDCGTCIAPSVCGAQDTPNICAVPLEDRECTNGWCWEAPAPFAWFPTAVFARTASDVWMVGSRGVIKHFDGTAWRVVPSGTTAELYGLWMASASDGWIVGQAGTLLRWNGTAWAAVASGTTNDLKGISGTSASDVWLVGGGVSKKWNGSAWADAATSTPFLDKIYVAPNDQVFATGSGLVYENAGGSWSARSSGTGISGDDPFFTAIAGSGTTAYAVGGVSAHLLAPDYDWVWRWDGTTWTRVDEPGNDEYWYAFSDGTNVFASTERAVWNMATTAQVPLPNGGMMRGPIGGAEGEMFAASDDGEPYHWKSSQWTGSRFGDLVAIDRVAVVGAELWFILGEGAAEWNHGLARHDLGAPLRSLSGTARDNVWALADNNTYTFRFDGKRWQSVPIPSSAMNAIYTTADRVIVMGDGVYHHDIAGGDWVAETAPVGVTWEAYAAVGDDLYVIGTAVTATSRTPQLATRAAASGTWSALTVPAMENVCAIAAAAADDIWVSGWDDTGSTRSGAIAHWDGIAWTVTKPPGAVPWCTLALGHGELWAAGSQDGGAVHHRVANGTWATLPGNPTGDVLALVFDQAGTLWATGSNGAIFHR